ncbi:MAG: tetratricopeptide repeat protein [Deltaproteobacteria bacterium]|nr:tetratricopeptide repeat protein [Deltaproteobacteria bacterium]
MRYQQFTTGVTPLIALLPLMALWSTGCAHKHVSTEPAITPLPEIHVAAEKQNGGQVIDAYDAATLFERGNRLLGAERFADAIETYRRLENEFPRSPYLAPTLYNLGICLDKTGQYDAAVDTYQKLLRGFPDFNDVKNARFRLADSLEALARWDDLIGTLDTLSAQTPDLTPVDKVEIHAKKGAALIETNQPALAKIELEQAVRVFTRAEGVSPTAPDFYYSMAQFKLAELTHAQMRQVSLPADDKALEAILEKKCRLLLDAQYLYTQVIRIGHPHWCAAAAYRTGALYHHLWEDMLAAKPPTGLTDSEQEVYMEVLRKRITILLKKAVKQWRRTLAFAMRLNLDNAWIAQTRQDLKEIESVLEIEEQVGADLP